MDITLLVTNGGPHPADKWAALTSERIAALIQVDEQSDSDAAAIARKAKPRFAIAVSDAIEAAFSDAMSNELSKVNSGQTAIRHAAFQVSDYVDAAITAVKSISDNTPFASHFSQPDVQSMVRNIITQNILDAANVQRSWAFDAKGL